jgi:hypothetical protein
MRFPLRFCVLCAGLLSLSPCLQARAGKPPARTADTVVVIPGPQRSFLRMAGVSQEVSPDQVLPVLARNISLLGFQSGHPTEFLILLNRYVHQARELAQMAGPDGEIRVANCDGAARLVEVLGYKLQGVCGQRTAALITADPERAFLTIDSGFPLTQFEQALGKNAPFNYPYPGTQVPMFFSQQDWANVSSKSKKAGEDLLDLLLNDQDVDRLYWALSRCDQETRLALLNSPGLHKLATLAPVFSLYGGGVDVSAGRVVVPGNADKEWEDLVGARTSSPGDFVTRLLSKDRGWLAAYYDVMARLNQAQQAHLTAKGRLKNLYEAYRSTATHGNASDGVFPRNAELFILYTSLKWDPNGDLAVREGLDAWGEILSKKLKSGNGAHDWPERSHGLDTPEHLLEMLVSQTNFPVNNGPVQIFLMLEAINAGKPAGQRLSNDTEQLVADRLAQFSHWFQIFAEFPELDDTSITRFVTAADHMDGISNPTLRANGLGALQANIGLWQIFARQGQIPVDQLNKTWLSGVQPFIAASTSVQFFEASRNSLQSLLVAASGRGNLTQDEIVDLLAGPAQNNDDGKRVHQELARRIHAVLDDQRLVSLDTLFGLYDGLGDMAHGAALGDQLLPLAGNLREFEMPRAIFTGSEKIEWSPIVYTSRHAELQIRTDLARIIKSGTPAQLEAARGELTPFLRDTLVGLNYAYYEPPGAEVLHNNPLFVRSHDFSSVSVLGVEHVWGEPGLIGVGATAGGGAYLMGSLADLPYALAATEQDFIAPRNVQALIWKEAVPDLLVDAVLPRWWAVSQSELHSAALHQRAGEELLTSSATNADLRGKVIGILSDRMSPDRLEKTQSALEKPETVGEAFKLTAPAEDLYLAAEFRRRYPDQTAVFGPAGRELDDLLRKNPSETSAARLSEDFGTPHPELLLSNSLALVNTKPIPAYSGSASRLLAESWESNNLYWARLADEMGYPPVVLNVLVPALTRHMVANIFASNIDDWPALLRAMHETGSEFRQGKITLQAATLVARQ